MPKRRPFSGLGSVGRHARRGAYVAVAASSLAGGCTGVDGAELAEFRPVSSNLFEYYATTSPFYGPSPVGWSERQRLDWLSDYLRLNAMCPAGYEILSRNVSFEYQSFLAYPVDEIEYRGRCRS